MKALVLKEYMKLKYEETPTPEPGTGEVLVAVKACGICGSDASADRVRRGKWKPERGSMGARRDSFRVAVSALACDRMDLP